MVKDIKFYCGEENGVVVEKDVIDESIFKEQYSKAIKLIDHIIVNPSKDIPSIVAFCGDRGEGKFLWDPPHILLKGTINY